MAATSALNRGADEMVTVRLSQIKPELRLRVAEILERQWTRAGVGAFDLLRLHLAANGNGLVDPEIEVPEWKAWLVLVEGKRPPGPTPVYSPPRAKTIATDDP